MALNISNKAKQIGISQGYLSNILAGRRRFHYKKAKVAARLTRTPVELWLEGDPNDMRKALEASEKEVA